jgi:predicted MFS family arabinose efflux permease
VVPSIAVNGMAFLYASFTMLMLDLDPAIRRSQRTTGSVLHDAIEGVHYVTRHKGIGPIMLFAATMGMLLRAVPEMLPPYVEDLFGRGAEGLATLASAMGCAALVGGSYVAMRGRLQGLTRVALLAGLGLAFATACFAATHWFAVGVVCIAGMGMATTMHGIAIQTLLQSSCSPHMVGRVLSLWGMITRAAPAMGALVYGAASEVVGLQIPVLVGAAICLTMWFRTWRRRSSIAAALEVA